MTIVTQGSGKFSRTQLLRELLRRLPLECERELRLRDRLLPLECDRDRLREVLRCERDLLLRDFFGTFAPSRRASDNPMAMACFRLVTFLPLRPLFSLPRFISCISSRTFSPARRLYFLPPDERCEDELFLVAIERSPFIVLGSNAASRGCAQASQSCIGSCLQRCVARLARARRRRQNVFHVHPLRRIIAGVAGHAELVPLAAIAGLA